MTQRLSLALAGGFFVAMLGLVLWLGWPTASSIAPGNRVFVVTTIYPLTEFAEQVGGEHVYASSVIPAGVEPHDYEPTPGDVTQVLNADVVLYLGAGLDDWVGETTHSDSLFAGIGDGVDPHVWLDPVLAMDMVIRVRDGLIAVDPAHAHDYTANAETYIEKLQTLNHDYMVGLEECQLDAIIVSHDAMSYLAQRYDFEALGISGISPEAEPSIKDLSRLAREASRLKIKTIFFETLVSPKLAETLAKEVGAETAVLNPLEGLSAEELAAGDDYILVMRANLEALRKAMLCR